MENLSEEVWDVVIAGTSLPQALLALSLSRSGLKVLHVDKHNYYGGTDAGLSLDEAQQWADEHRGHDGTFGNASVTRHPRAATLLSASRSYTLSLKPQIIYASGPFLPSLVTSRVHNQLEFLAVGSWWIHKEGKLQRIPSTREDVFADDTLSRRDKMGLMKFLRHVTQEESLDDTKPEVDEEISLQQALSSKFRIAHTLHSPLSALALAPEPIGAVKFATATTRIRRHITSMGYFGPGFAAVYPKYAGNAEISQVACRAGAVGGAVYLLGQGIDSITTSSTLDKDEIEVQLTNGLIIRTKNVVGGLEDIPEKILNDLPPHTHPRVTTLNSISVVSDPLTHLFSQTSENSPTPAVTIVLIDEFESGAAPSKTAPVYLQIHSGDTGESPLKQCVVYASTYVQDPQHDLDEDLSRLEAAVHGIVTSGPSSDHASEKSANAEVGEVLWSMSYTSTGLSIQSESSQHALPAVLGRILIFPPRVQDLAFDNSVLSGVKAFWESIVGKQADDDEFLVFTDRNLNDE